MKQISAEDIVLNLVCNGGDCRSKALQAIRTARAGNIAEAETLLEEAQKSLQAAHHFQTDLIQGEMQEDGEPVEVRLLMVHGQDHLMDAMVVSDLAYEMVELCKELQALKNQ